MRFYSRFAAKTVWMRQSASSRRFQSTLICSTICFHFASPAQASSSSVSIVLTASFAISRSYCVLLSSIFVYISLFLAVSSSRCVPSYLSNQCRLQCQWYLTPSSAFFSFYSFITSFANVAISSSSFSSSLPSVSFSFASSPLIRTRWSTSRLLRFSRS